MRMSMRIIYQPHLRMRIRMRILKQCGLSADADANTRYISSAYRKETWVLESHTIENSYNDTVHLNFLTSPKQSSPHIRPNPLQILSDQSEHFTWAPQFDGSGSFTIFWTCDIILQFTLWQKGSCIQSHVLHGKEELSQIVDLIDLTETLRVILTNTILQVYSGNEWTV